MHLAGGKFHLWPRLQAYLRNNVEDVDTVSLLLKDRLRESPIARADALLEYRRLMSYKKNRLASYEDGSVAEGDGRAQAFAKMMTRRKYSDASGKETWGDGHAQREATFHTLRKYETCDGTIAERTGKQQQIASNDASPKKARVIAYADGIQKEGDGNAQRTVTRERLRPFRFLDNVIVQINGSQRFAAVKAMKDLLIMLMGDKPFLSLESLKIDGQLLEHVCL